MVILFSRTQMCHHAFKKLSDDVSDIILNHGRTLPVSQHIRYVFLWKQFMSSCWVPVIMAICYAGLCFIPPPPPPPPPPHTHTHTWKKMNKIDWHTYTWCFSHVWGIVEENCQWYNTLIERRINSLRPSAIIWQHRSGSTLAQVMAC